MIENNYEEAQTYQDPNSPSELELKHVPIIEIDTNKVKVTVGEEKHVMEVNHWIQYIEVFADEDSIGRVDLSLGDEPEAEFDVDVPNCKKIIAQELCNIHGLWQNELEINNSKKKK